MDRTEYVQARQAARRARRVPMRLSYLRYWWPVWREWLEPELLAAVAKTNYVRLP